MLKTDMEEVIRALGIFTEPGQVTELRAPKGGWKGRSTISGYYDQAHASDFAKDAAKIEAPGIYFMLNPVHPDLHSLRYNRVYEAGTGETTSDKDILRRRWFYVDCDPLRRTGISATDAEKAQAWAVALAVAEYTTGLGWPAPVIVDSGNGYHLYYRVELPAEDGGKISRILGRLNYLFGNGNEVNPASSTVKIDTSVANAARITKVPGTPARKGDDTPNRPHRLSHLLTVPDPIQIVPEALLEALAGQETAPKPVPSGTPSGKFLDLSSAGQFDVGQLLKRPLLSTGNPVEVAWVDDYNGGKRWTLDDCPHRPGDGRTYTILQFASGGVSSGCSHGTCIGNRNGKRNDWQAFKALFGIYPSDNAGGVFPEEAPEDPRDIDLWAGVDSITPAKASVPRLDCMRWSEMRGQPVPPVEYVWDPFLTRVAFGLIAGNSGHGKSILEVQIAVAIATGLPLFDFPVGAPGGVGIVALEDDHKALQRRISAAVDSYGSDFTEEHHRLLDANMRTLVRSKNPLAYLDPESLDMALAGLVEQIEQDMKTCEAPARLCIVDTLNAVHDGDENSAQETRPLVAAIFGLHARLGCSVYASHHLRKVGTARSAPPLTDRLDPDLVRGSGALVGAVRAVVQLGWIYPKEAAKVGLTPENSARRYAILALTKVNDGPPSPWLLLEHTANAGLWTPVPNGASILAKLRGAEAVEKAGNADLVLMAMHEAGTAGQPFDRKAAADRLFGDNKKPSSSLNTYLGRLAVDRLVTLDKKGLTEAGLKRVRELLDAEGDENVA